MSLLRSKGGFKHRLRLDWTLRNQLDLQHMKVPASKKARVQRLAWDPALDIIIQPPAFCEAEGEGQELCLGRELVGNEQATLAQQRLAVLDCDLHVARGVQHICGKYDVIAPDPISLQTQSLSYKFGVSLKRPKSSRNAVDGTVAGGHWTGHILTCLQRHTVMPIMVLLRLPVARHSSPHLAA